jgi:hypothetical protein
VGQSDDAAIAMDDVRIVAATIGRMLLARQ